MHRFLSTPIFLVEKIVKSWYSEYNQSDTKIDNCGERQVYVIMNGDAVNVSSYWHLTPDPDSIPRGIGTILHS